MDYKAHIEKLDQLIAQGRLAPIKSELLNLNRKKIPRIFLNQYSNLARRAGQFLLASKFINPIINTDESLKIIPTDEELLTYAACLAQLGASEEAITIIDRVQDQDTPETVFKRCMALVSNWNYQKTIPLLVNLLKNKNLSDYQKIITKLNLAAAQLVEGQIMEARNLLLEIRDQSKNENYNLLLGTILEHLAKSYIYDEEFDEAEKYLKESENLLKETDNFHLYMAKKWLIINEILKTKSITPEIIQKSETLRGEAYNRKYWMILRDLDLYTALSERDYRKLTHVFFGSPFQPYRLDITGRLYKDFKIPEFYDWRVGRTLNQEGLRVFDLQSGKELDSEISLNRSQLPYKLLQLLSSDFYRPFNVGTVFSYLYPHEKFDPFHSPDRIKKVVYRFRKWAKDNGVPLGIQVLNLEFRVVSTKPYVLRTRVQYEDRPNFTQDIKKLLELHSSPYINLPNAMKLLNKNRKYVSELFKWAEKNDQIKRRGQGSGTTYLIK